MDGKGGIKKSSDMPARIFAPLGSKDSEKALLARVTAMRQRAAEKKGSDTAIVAITSALAVKTGDAVKVVSAPLSEDKLILERRIKEEIETERRAFQDDLESVGDPHGDGGAKGFKEHMPRYIALVVKLAKLIGKNAALTEINGHSVNILVRDHGGKVTVSSWIDIYKDKALLSALDGIA